MSFWGWRPKGDNRDRQMLHDSLEAMREDVIDDFSRGGCQQAQRPVLEAVELPQPRRTAVIYLQDEHGWRAYPQDVPTISRGIHLSPAPHTMRETWYRVDVVGAYTSGTAFVWK